MPVVINAMPNEIPDAVPFPEDSEHATYDPVHARLLWRALLDTQRVLTRFDAGFLGKASPVHFFWGSFDMAVTRFSGRLAPPHPGGVPNFPDDVAREAYSQELTSCGFWPGNRLNPEPIFYAYAYPTPDGYPNCGIEPEAAFWLEDLGEFALPYRDVANATEPDATLLSFVQSAHEAAAELANWDRARLECSDPHGPDWWENRPPGGYDGHVTDHNTVFRHDPDRHRYVAEAEGTVVAETLYAERDDRFVFVHTEVDPDMEGRGLGSDLTRFALDDMRANRRRIQALCPFTAGWIDRHPDYEDLLA